jgi:hypothetical protein
MDLLGADSATINAPDLDFVEDRLHRGAGSHQKGGRPQGKGSPRGGQEDPHSRPPASTTSSACLYSFGGESSGRRSVEVPVDPGLAPRPQGVSPDISPQGSPPDRHLRVSPIGADDPLLLLGRRRRTGSHQRTQPEVGLRVGLPLPSNSPQEGYQEAGKARGKFLLVTPYWQAQTWFASIQALPMEDVCRLPFSDDLIIDLTTGEPSPNLERLFLVVLTILGGIVESTPSQTGPSVSSRQDGSDLQKTATKERGNPSRPFSALPPFLSIRHL